MKTKLLDHLVSVGNKSGVMPPSPAGLKDLKSAIEAVPFSVSSKGMSGVVSLPNMVPNLVEQIKTLGSLSAVGEFRNLMGRLQSELAGQSIDSVSTEALTAALEKVVDLDEMVAAVGDSTALLHSLRSYASAAGTVTEVAPPGAVAPAYTFVPNTDHSHAQSDIVGLVADLDALETGIGSLETAIGDLEGVTHREVLTANRTYYVRTDGSDSNDGLADTSGGAFLTIQKAIDVVHGTLDLYGWAVTIQVGAGTYNVSTIYAVHQWTGAGYVYLKGDTTTPSNVVISATSHAIWVGDGVLMSIEGFKITSSTGSCIVADNHSQVRIAGKMDFGSAALSHLYASSLSKISCTAVDYTISAAAPYHAVVGDNGVLVVNLNTITLTGTPAFGYFLYSDRGSIALFYSNTFSGSATGARFFVSSGSIVYTGTSGNLSYYPGNSGGTIGAGSLYDSITGGRHVLTAARTYYVRTDGSDSNDGLTNSASGAFLTWQKAVDVISGTLDLSTYDVTVDVGNGTYTGQVTIEPLVTSGGKVIFTGDTTTPANVLLSTSGDAISTSVPITGTYKFEGLRVTTSGGNFMALSHPCFVELGVFTLGACANRGIECTNGARVQCLNNFTIDGNTPNWIIRTTMGGFVAINNRTITHSGTRSYTSGFIECVEAGTAHAYSVSITGTFTGKNYNFNTAGGCTLGGGGTTYFGGSVAGTVTSPGWKT